MSYSQGKEEQWIADYFGNTIGTFIDLGANDGETLSNTRALALKGWAGLCVDASPMAAGMLRNLYSENDNVQTIWTGVGSQTGTLPFWDSGTHLHAGDFALLSTFNEAEMLRWKSSGEAFVKVDVPIITFAQLMEKSKLRTFDFVSIDIEGNDLAVLYQMDLGAMGCKMLIVEANESDPLPFITHAQAHGLKYVRRNAENLCFQR